jgi:hypothetical protein
MERSELFFGSAVLFLAIVLFLPRNSNIWIAFLILAIISVFFWFKIKKGE